MHQSAIAAIRDTGAQNIIVCDENDWATMGALRNLPTIQTADSAALTYGPSLRNTYGNIVFSPHVYHQFNTGGAGKLSDYFERVQAANLPVIVGEWGQRAFAPYESITATKAMFTAVRNNRVGRIAWHWYPGDDNKLTTETNSYTPGGGWFIDKVDGSRPTNLSWIGELAWDDNRGSYLIIDNQPTPLDRTGWTATASSSHGDHTPAKALDGLFGDYFNPSASFLSGTGITDGLWLQIDMGQSRTLNRVDVSAQPGNFGPHGLKIYLSNSATAPGTAIATVSNKAAEKRISFPQATGRYLRIETSGGLNWGGWWEVYEVNAYGPTTPTTGFSATTLYRLKNNLSGLYLTSDGNSNEWLGVRLASWNAYSTQKWNIVSNGDGSYRLSPTWPSNRVLTADGDTTSGKIVMQAVWNFSYNTQKWNFTSLGSGNHLLYPNWPASRSLGVDSSSEWSFAKQLSSNSASAQSWNIEIAP